MNKTIQELAEYLITRIEAEEDEATLCEMMSVADLFERGQPLPEHHIATSPFHPVQVIIDCDVKLQMVRQAMRTIEAGEIVMDTFGGNSPAARVERGMYLQAAASWSMVLRMMGLAYAHRPDYQEDWRP